MDTKPTTEDATHFRLDGGKLKVCDTFHERFLRRYASAVSAGELLSLNERRTEVYQMHFDLDFNDTVEMSWESVWEVLRVLQRTLGEFLTQDAPADTLELLLLKAPPKVLAEGVKTGFHAIYPNFRVDSCMALTMCDAVVGAVQRELGRRLAPRNAWEDVIDRAVHEANGLRMVYATKPRKARCADCLALRKCRGADFTALVACPECRGAQALGFVNEGRPYVPYRVLDAGGNMDAAACERGQSDVEGCVRRGRIGCVSVGEGQQRIQPKVCVFYRRPARYAEAEAGKKRKARNLLERRSDCRPKSAPSVMPGNSEVVGALERFLRSHPAMVGLAGGANPYASVSIKKLERKSDVLWYAQVAGEGQHYCNNVGREHASNSVYFEVRHGKGLAQRCWDRASCKGYASKYVPLDAALRRLLFLEKEQQAPRGAPGRGAALRAQVARSLTYAGVQAPGFVVPPAVHECAAAAVEELAARTRILKERLPASASALVPAYPAAAGVSGRVYSEAEMRALDGDVEALMRAAMTQAEEERVPNGNGRPPQKRARVAR